MLEHTRIERGFFSLLLVVSEEKRKKKPIIHSFISLIVASPHALRCWKNNFKQMAFYSTDEVLVSVKPD